MPTTVKLDESKLATGQRPAPPAPLQGPPTPPGVPESLDLLDEFVGTEEDNDEFRGLAFGTGDLVRRSGRMIFNLERKMRRLEMDNLIKVRRGKQIAPAIRPKDQTTSVIPYCTNIIVTVTSLTSTVDRSVAQIKVQFSRPADSRNWAFAQIAVKGYRSNPNWVYVATTSQSPARFVLEITGETIQIAVASMNSHGEINDVTLAPTASVVLNANRQIVNAAGSATANPLTQSGTTTTINVAATTWNFGIGTITYNSGSVNPGSFGTWFVFADDPLYAGGAVTYQASSNASDPLKAVGRLYFGKITTAGGGGGLGSGGGNGGGRGEVY